MWRHVQQLARAFSRGLIDLLYPPACAVCSAAIPPDADDPRDPLDRHFCSSCRSVLTDNPHEACPRCAAPVGPYALVEGGCSHCRELTFHFDASLRLARYDGLLREVVLRLKHRSSESLAELMGVLTANQLRDHLVSTNASAIVPVPLHWSRRLRRGYNQAAAVAHGLAEHLHLPVVTSCLRRIRATPSQAHQPPSQRRENVRGAFRARPHALVKNAAVLLVDDVMTTGSTLSEAARALRQASAARVVAVVLARAGFD
jgi:ComF family protein